MTKMKLLIATALSFNLAGLATASPLTDVSPSGFDVTSVGVSSVGGVVVDLYGKNGNHVVAQLSAQSIQDAAQDSMSPDPNDPEGLVIKNPLLLGVVAGYSDDVMAALAGGLASVSVRLTVFDADTAATESEANQNTLMINGFDFGNLSDVATESNGLVGQGFGNNVASTGWFYLEDTPAGTSSVDMLFDALFLSRTLTVEIIDSDFQADNVLSFKTQVPADQIANSQPPTAYTSSNNVPEPASLALIGLGLAGLLSLRRNR